MPCALKRSRVCGQGNGWWCEEFAAELGVVVSDKMQKTVVVAVERLVRHHLYRKTLKRTSTFMAHDQKGAKKGDRVRIVESRPLSRTKRWRVAEILERAHVAAGAAAPDAGI